MKDAAMHELIAKIKSDLVQAMKDRKSVEASARRSLLARISSAEAIPAPAHLPPSSGPIAGASAGVGSTEMPRKQLSYADIQAVIRDEIQEIQSARSQLDASNSYAIELDQKLAVLHAYQ